ncbi:MAG: PAS domain-containing protein [Chloroflexi bacterium]|nr:PAS domain-containing protein [Chloroflexota bacterium]
MSGLVGSLATAKQLRGLNWRLCLLIPAVFVAGMVWLDYLVRRTNWTGSLDLNTLLFTLLIIAAGLFPLPVGPRIKAGVTTAPLFLAALILPPGAAALAAMVGGLVYLVGLRFKPPVMLMRWYKYPFNTGETALSTGMASWAFHLLAGDNLTTLAVLVPLVLMYVVNTGLVSLVAGTQIGVNPAKLWWGGTKENGLAEVSLFSFGYLGAVSYHENPPILIALLVPVVIIYFVFSRLASTNAAVEKERNALSSIMASMSEGLVVIDKGDTLAYCNPSAERVLDIAASDFVGKPVSVFEQAWQARVVDHDGLVRAWKDGVLRAPERPAVDFDLLSGGQRLTIQARLFSVGALGTGVVLRDITRESEVDRMKADFVSIVSHELRTPMTVVYGFAELLLVSQGLTEQQKEWAGRIHSEGQRLTNIVEDLLDVSRIEAGRLSLKLAPLVLRPLVARVGDALSTRYPAHVFQIDLAEDFPLVRGDEEKLLQVFHNLMDNAAKYSPRGGPITVAAQAGTERKEVVISITDHGLGIPQAEMPRLFTRFHRIQRPETEGVRGTGLGLYIVKSLVELMGGRVWLESVLSEGSTFHLALPLPRSNGHGLRACEFLAPLKVIA